MPAQSRAAAERLLNSAEEEAASSSASLPSDALANVGVAISGLTAQVGDKIILKGVDAVVPARALCAVMGPSGSGKTSLIRALAAVPGGLRIAGRASLLGGCAATAEGGGEGVVGYLPQYEDLLPLLTVQETLMFAAALRRVPDPAAVVEALLDDLALRQCAGTRLGSGASGGERRRVSLAIRLLRKTALLCVDEPTSGLDSRSAGLVVDLLQKLTTQRQCTVLCSIHQPRQEIFDCFTHLLLLSDGFLVYGGPVPGALQHVEAGTGLACPDAGNPADFVIDACALDRTSAFQLVASSDRIARLVEQQRLHRPFDTATLNKLVASGVPLLQHSRGRFNFRTGRSAATCRICSETCVLSRRAFVCARRDRLLFLAVLMQNLMFGLVFGLMNWQLSTATLPEVHSRLALIYITPGLSGFFVMSANLYLLCEQIVFFDDERHRDNLYSSVAFVLSQFLAVLPLNVAAPVPMCILVYFMANLRLDVIVAPVVFYSVLVLVRMHSSALAIFMTVLIPRRSFATSSVVTNAFFLLCIFTGGFLTPIASLPKFLSWFRWLAYTFYAFRWNASAQFSDFSMDVGLPGRIVLEQLGFEEHDFVKPPLCILGLTCCWLVLAVVALCLLVPRPPPPPAEGDTTALAAPETSSQRGLLAAPGDGAVVSHTSAASSGQCVRLDAEIGENRSSGLAVQLDSVSLEVIPSQWRAAFGGGARQVATTKILDDVSVDFAPACLTAIVGPSGAGKTSLLSVLAGRACGRSARLTGTVSVGGSPSSQTDLQQHVALVGQEDHHLPGLTVEETIRYYARLRLHHDSPETRSQRVLSLVNALGLSGCLQTRVGSQGKGGISGGERRRLSVLMACLGEPAVLLLDEPTTGLDALAAQQLVNLLTRLVKQRGQTVACSVHQPRSDLLPLFDRILLLGPGGRVLLEGTMGDLEAALAASGARPSPLVNVLDFAMDFIGDAGCAAELRAAWAPNGRARDEEMAASRTSDATTQARRQCSWTTAFRILLARSLLNFVRQPAMIWARCAQVVIYAIVLLPVYAPLGNSQSSVTSRIGLLYQSLGMLFAGTLNNLAVFPMERDVLLRESSDGLYSVAPFFAVYTLCEVALETITTVVAGTTIVQAAGLVGGWQPQLTFIAVLLASLFNGESIGIILNSVVMHAGFSVNMINGLCAMLQIMAGFMANSLPAPLAALNHLSPQMYACRALAVSQFPEDLTFECDGPSPICLRTGLDVLDMLGLSGVGSVDGNLVGVAVCCIAFRTLSYLILRYRVSRQSSL